MSSWPGFPATAVLRNFYFDDTVTDELLTLLEKAGWSAS